MFGRRSRRASALKRKSRTPRLLRCEPLESRMVLSASVGGVYAKAQPATPPSLVHSASAGGSTVAGKSTTLSVLGNDAQGASSLTYDWTVASAPSGGTAKFSVNNTNAAQNDTATFSEAGTYSLLVTITDPSKLSVTSSAKVTVAQTVTSVSILAGTSTTAVNPNSPLKVTSASQSLKAEAFDQFGNPMTTQPSFSWNWTTKPANAAASLSGSGGTETVTFPEAGNYGFVAVANGGSNAYAVVNMTVAGLPKAFTVSQVGGSQEVYAATAQFTVGQVTDQFGNPLAESTTLTWAATTVPTGAAAPKYSTVGSTTTVTLYEAGKYVFSVRETDSAGNSVTDSVSLTVGQVPTGVDTGSTITVTGTSQVLTTPVFLDQFGKPISGMNGLGWKATTVPSGAAAPTFPSSNAGTTADFSMAGTYVLTDLAQSNSTAAYSVTVQVKQTLTSLSITPGNVSLASGSTQQFSAAGLDQFKNPMATAPTIAWTATGGTISSAGLYTAGATVGNSYSVTAKSGTLSSMAYVMVTKASPTPSPSPSPTPSPSPSPAPGGIQDPTLAAFVAQLFAASDSLNREDMIEILTSVGGSGAVSAEDFADLKTILKNAAEYNMPNYVEVLASDVVNGNAANATYLGASLGNLAAGSSKTQLTDLISKWFYGTDLPTLTSSAYTYTTVSGTLFPNTPSSNDEYQGELGDCYFISSLGTIANTNPQAIENMFINNGDGTYTVRFYGGALGEFYNSNGTISDGFASGTGTADYVTVNLALPAYDGMLVYADYGASASNPNNSLWIPLAEKAYAEWNQTGNEGRDGTNTYNSIQGGWMATVDAQVLGHNATDYNLTGSTEQAMISALAANQAVTVATDSSSNSGDTLPGGLFGSHAYAVLSYSASTGQFTLYNPWGFDQPGGLTWSQLEATCEGFVTATTSGSVPISGGVQAHVGAAVAGQVSAVASDVSASLSAATGTTASSAERTTAPIEETVSAASGDVSDSHQTRLFADGSTPYDSAADLADQATASRVDAVFGSDDVGLLFFLNV
jgi:hypothetical protein